MRTFQEQISIVIPTLDDAAELAKTLAALAREPAVREIIISDGGSSDGTVAVARRAGAAVRIGEPGRGAQLAAGAAMVAADWLLFLHADCRPGAGWRKAVAAFIARPDAAHCAGYFDLALDDGCRAARRLESIVAWRCRRLGLPYGDQGLLISRKLYDAVGGFRPLPLMEDVDLARRLGRSRLRPIGAQVVASARRYRSAGYIRRPLRNLFCLSLYFAGVPPARIVPLYR